MRILIATTAVLLVLAVPAAAQSVRADNLPNPCGGGGGDGGGSCSGGDWCPPECSSCGSFSAVVIGASGSSWDLSGLDDPVTFDIGGLGGVQTIGWTARASELSFLALDRNHNGVIDDATELFGTRTATRSGATARNGFSALSEFDANGDGVIDQSDPIWRSLLLWTDRNHDAVSQQNELTPVAASGITRIELKSRYLVERDLSGNYFAYEAAATAGNSVLRVREVFMLRGRP